MPRYSLHPNFSPIFIFDYSISVEKITRLNLTKKICCNLVKGSVAEPEPEPEPPEPYHFDPRRTGTGTGT
jgi:hypothetical protein